MHHLHNLYAGRTGHIATRSRVYFNLSTSKEPLILRLQCINYKYYFLFSLSWSSDCSSSVFLFCATSTWRLLARVHFLECSIKKPLTILFCKWKSISYRFFRFHNIVQPFVTPIKISWSQKCSEAVVLKLQNPCFYPARCLLLNTMKFAKEN